MTFTSKPSNSSGGTTSSGKNFSQNTTSAANGTTQAVNNGKSVSYIEKSLEKPGKINFQGSTLPTNSSSGSSDSSTSPSTFTVSYNNTNSSITCIEPSLNLTYTSSPTSSQIKSSYSVGELITQVCPQSYVFEIALQPVKIYKCLKTGKWAGSPENCICKF